MHEKQDESNGRKLLAEPLIFRQTVDSCIDYKRSCRVQLQPNFVNKENIHTHTHKFVIDNAVNLSNVRLHPRRI
jgi:hypothetical protein